jgi:hypothetical protein
MITTALELQDLLTDAWKATGTYDLFDDPAAARR